MIFRLNKFFISKIVFLIFFIFSILANNVDVPVLNYSRFKLFEIVAFIPIFILSLKNFFNLNEYRLDIFKSIIFVLLIVSLISTLIQISFKPIIYTFIFCILVISLHNFSNEDSNQHRISFKKIIEIIILVTSLFLIICLFLGDNKYGSDFISTFRFRGIFNNSNQLGRFASLAVIIAFLYILEFKKTSKLIKNLSLLNIILGLIFISLSNSRSAIVVLVISLIFYFFILDSNKKKKILEIVRKKKILFLSTISLLSLIGYQGFIYTLLKFKNFRFEEGFSSYRLQFLRDSYEYLNFFGYSNFKIQTNICDKFFKVWPRVECDVHNLYLNIFLNFGGIYLVIFLTLILYIFFDCQRKLNFNYEECKFTLVTIVYSITLFVFENGILLTNFLLVFLFYGYLCRRKRY